MINKHFIQFFIIFLFFCTYEQGFSQNDKLVQVNINPAKTYQQIESISGNFCQATYTDNAWDDIGEYLLQKFKPTHIRVPMPLKLWEPENDNQDPNSIQYDKFLNRDVNLTLFNSLKEMKTLYNVKNFTISVWDVPDWMVSNPQEKAQRKIDKEMYPEVIESIAAFMYVAKSDYGIEFDYFSFNEATGGYQVLFSADEIIDFIGMAGPYFATMGFKTKFLVADSHSTIATHDYANKMLERTDLEKYLGPISFHSWWSTNIPDSEFNKIYALGKKFNKPVWCCELGFDAMAYTKQGVFQTWEYAFSLARITLRVLKHSGATVTQYWTYQDNFPLLSKTLDPYPSFYITQMFTEHLPPGTRIIDADSDDQYILALAGKINKNQYSVILMNTSSQQRKIRVNNLAPGTYNIYLSDSNNNYSNIESVSLSDNLLDLTINGNSLITVSNIK